MQKDMGDINKSLQSCASTTSKVPQVIKDEFTAKIEQHKQVLTDARLGLETISSGWG